jgi:hypothetical protein
VDVEEELERKELIRQEGNSRCKLQTHAEILAWKRNKAAAAAAGVMQAEEDKRVRLLDQEHTRWCAGHRRGSDETSSQGSAEGVLLHRRGGSAGGRACACACV